MKTIKKSSQRGVEKMEGMNPKKGQEPKVVELFGDNLFKEFSKKIPIEKLKPHQLDVIHEINRSQSKEYKATLHDDIKNRGVLTPLMVKEDLDEPGFYKIVCGNLRWEFAHYEYTENKDQRFKTLRCDVLRDDVAEPIEVEIALADNANRQGISPIGRHLMLATHREIVKEIVEPYRTGDGNLEFPSRLSSSELSPIEKTKAEMAQRIISRIQETEKSSIDEYTAQALGVGSNSTVFDATKTVKAIARTIKSQFPETGDVPEDKVSEVVKALRNVPSDSFSKEIFKKSVKSLWKILDEDAGPEPLATYSVSPDKEHPGFLMSQVVDLCETVKRVQEERPGTHIKFGNFGFKIYATPEQHTEDLENVVFPTIGEAGKSDGRIAELKDRLAETEKMLENRDGVIEKLEKELKEAKTKIAEWEARPEEEKKKILETENPTAEHEFNEPNVTKMFDWIGHELKSAIKHFGGPVGAIHLWIRFGGSNGKPEAHAAERRFTKDDVGQMYEWMDAEMYKAVEHFGGPVESSHLFLEFEPLKK